MKIKKAMGMLLAVLIALTACPSVFANIPNGARYEAPSGYNANDYDHCVDFLESTDEYGLKNGEKLSASYDPLDPHSWGTYTENGVQKYCFQFGLSSGEYRLMEIKANDCDLVGVMDLSNCTSLHTVNCVQNRIRGFDVAGCESLRILNFLRNEVQEIDVSSNYALTDLGTAENPIKELDLSNNPRLHNLFVGGGPMQELDLSHNPELPMQRIYAQGNGTVGYMYLDLGVADMLALYPGAFEGEKFLGWYTEEGELVNNDPDVFSVPNPWMYDVLIARYTGYDDKPTEGDVDGSGEVNALDALMVLRASLGLLTLTPEQITAADVNGDGAVNALDALAILRISLGL